MEISQLLETELDPEFIRDQLSYLYGVPTSVKFHVRPDGSIDVPYGIRMDPSEAQLSRTKDILINEGSSGYEYEEAPKEFERDHKIEIILNKHIKTRNVAQCQADLINAGLVEQARM